MFTVGCSQKEVAPQEVASQAEDTSKTYTMRISHPYSVVAQHHLNAVKWKEMIEERSKGRIKVEIFPGAQLMPSDQEYSGILDGRIQAALPVPPVAAIIEPSMYIMDVSYLLNLNNTDYPALDLAKDYMRSETFKKYVIDKFESKGLKIWPTFTDTPSVISSNVPIRAAKDLKGLKIRSVGGKYGVLQGKCLGYSSTTVNPSELPTALMQGTIDGALTYPIYTHDNKLPVKYVTEIPIARQGGAILMAGTNFYNDLPADLQEVMDSAGHDMLDWSYDNVMALYEQSLKNMEKQGIEIIKLPHEEHLKLISAVQPLWEEYQNTTDGGKELIDEVKRLQK